MDYKKFVKIWLYTIVIGICGIFAISTIVDPIDLLGMPILKGINNNKDRQQDRFLDVFKPYQVVKYKPEVIFIGSSRVYYALQAELDGYEDEKVYNMGFSSLPFDNMEKYLDFVYKINKPQKIFIGLDLFQFGKDNFNNTKRNFSQTRLDKLSNCTDSEILIESLKENFQVAYLTLGTMRHSFRQKDNLKIYERGWFASHGSRLEVNYEEYYNTINNFANIYRNWVYEEASVIFLKRILEKARQNNVDVYVFFNPISVDLIALIKLSGLDDDLSQIKQEVVELAGIVYDFNYINEFTTNRRELFVDASHSNSKYGKVLKTDILNGYDTERMLLLSKEDVCEKLEHESKLSQEWFNNNKEYVTYLETEVINNHRKIENEELKNFIGF